MTLIQIIPYENGAHDNQTLNKLISIPEGWAVIPDDMETENFPFGDIEVEEINGNMTVTKWIPGIIPIEPEPILSPAQLREKAYNEETIIEWDNEMITVTQAAQLWQYYAAEGSEKANLLTTLIANAKEEIRNKYPD